MSDIFEANNVDENFSQFGQRIERLPSPTPVKKRVQSTLKITKDQKVRFEKKRKPRIMFQSLSSSDEENEEEQIQIVELSDTEETETDYLLIVDVPMLMKTNFKKKTCIYGKFFWKFPKSYS